MSSEQDAVERALALVYMQGYETKAPVAVAKVCDEFLDQSGAMLGRIRTSCGKTRRHGMSSKQVEREDE